VSTDGYGDNAEAKIDFGGSYGVKHLVLRYAPTLVPYSTAMRRG
jgi:DNA helicase II / ATP-dependent DNA helicase PcrA